MQKRLESSEDELVAAIYQAAANVIPASRPLEILAELTRSDKAFLARFNFDRKRGAILSSFNVEPNFIDMYNQLYSSQNPWVARASHFQAEGLVWRGSEIADLASIKETSFFKLFMYGQAIQHTLHLVVQVRGPDVLHVMLTRSPLAEDFDAAALEICRLFTRHARRAIEISKAVAAQQIVDQGLATAMDELSAGVAVIEPPATVRYMNRACDALLNGRSAGDLPGAAVANARPPFHRRVPRALVEALSAHPVPRSFVIRPPVDEGKRPVFVNIRSFQYQSNDAGLIRSGYVILCRTADSEIEVDEAALKAAYFLTSAEARVAAALVAGENVAAVAARLGISPETVRTHVKHIFEKTYTTRQAELMKLLMSVSQRKTAPTAPSVPPKAPSEQPDVIEELMKAIRRTPGAEFNS